MKNLVRYCLIGYLVDKGFNVLVAVVAITTMLVAFCCVFKIF